VCILWYLFDIVMFFFFFVFNRHYNPSWVSACSTVVEHSQQEGFTECRLTPNLGENQGFRAANFRHKSPPASEATLANPAAEGRTMSGKWPRNFAESGDFHVTFVFFYMPLNKTWDRRPYFPSEGRRAEDFFARKIRRFRPGLNPRTLPLDHRSR
jgi:hypothetical protein